MGTQIRAQMEELQSIFADAKNALAAAGTDPSMMGREPPDASRRPRSAVAAVSDEGEPSNVRAR